MTQLFGRDKSTISRQMNDVFKEGGLKREAVIAKNETTNQLKPRGVNNSPHPRQGEGVVSF
jgi:hypothetical protein